MLSAPLNWPPQSFEEWSAERDKDCRLSNFFIVRWFQKWNRESTYRWNYLFPIEEELTRQIMQRPPGDAISLSSTERELLELFATAFKVDRGTPSMPPIHIDDQLELLLWADDDLTLLQFKLMIEDRFHIRISQDPIRNVVIRPGATVEDLLKSFASIIGARKRG